MRCAIFANSWKDGYLVLVAAIELALLIYGTASFGAHSIAATLGIGALSVFLNCTNFQCVAHNFSHNPYFESPTLNRVFSTLNTLPLGVSQTLFRLHHLNHHQYNNDAQNPETGTTRDHSSTYRYSKVPDREGGIVSYAFIGPFRSELGFWMAEAKRAGRLPFVAIEMAALVAFVTLLGFANWKGLLGFYLPVWYLGQVSSLAENYVEHHFAFPGNRLTDSVSCYGGLYNFVWFNNGYHQEHHYRPQVHWSKVHEIRSSMLPESQRRVVRGAHWFNVKPNESLIAGSTER